MSELNTRPFRCNVLGVGIHAVDMDSAVRHIEGAVDRGEKGYVCVTGVHGVMEAQDDPGLRTTLNHSFLTVPDGMPMVWVGRLRRHRGMRRVYGPDLMLELCSSSVARGTTHFFFGGKPGTAKALQHNLETRFPGLQVVGTYTPPFRPMKEDEERQLADLVTRTRPDYFWVGLSTPKQECFMAAHLPRLDTTIMLGVGAAFDVHTGGIKDAPNWVKHAGLQWFHRLCQEPRRLWKRYLVNNPRFLARITLQLLGLRQYDL
jgi:N-acetylglucosaminyldiphosphoundecaprenol N-acetyl-beta-D-mannosaminyltransferase